MTFEHLIGKIAEIHLTAQQGATRSISRWLTERNWLVGYYLIEYEQNGQDRAEYGEQLIRKIAQQLKQKGLSGFSYRSLQQFKKFYLTYPHIVQTLSAQFTPGLKVRHDGQGWNDLTPAHVLLEPHNHSIF